MVDPRHRRLERAAVSLVGTVWQLKMTSSRTLVVLAISEPKELLAEDGVVESSFNGVECVLLDGVWAKFGPGCVTTFNVRWFDLENVNSARLA
jgi:hypothetical protein